MTKKLITHFMFSVAIFAGSINAMEQSKETSQMCGACTPFESNSNAIVKSKNFHASLYLPDQRVPRVVVAASSADYYTDELLQEFGQFKTALETALKKAFGADVVNVANLTNQAGEKEIHSYWHFIPRLQQRLAIAFKNCGASTLAEHVYEDPCYGQPYDLNMYNYRQISTGTSIIPPDREHSMNNMQIKQARNNQLISTSISHQILTIGLIKVIKDNFDISNLPEAKFRE